MEMNMTENKRTRTVTVPKQRGAIRNFVSSLKLILKLMGDRRVSPWVKLIPVGALIYWISPVDILMGIPGIDAIDDAAVLWIGSTLFIELCPPEVVQELRDELNGGAQDTSEEIVDADSTDVNDR
jgi:uncharacterized membrane protein YkvA (DUF1232 family)